MALVIALLCLLCTSACAQETSQTVPETTARPLEYLSSGIQAGIENAEASRVLPPEAVLRDEICELMGMEAPCEQYDVDDIFGTLLQGEPNIIFFWCSYSGTMEDNRLLLSFLLGGEELLEDGLGLEEILQIRIAPELKYRFVRNYHGRCGGQDIEYHTAGAHAPAGFFKRWVLF